MAADSPTSLYVFLVDTDSYAGNFEREMCAYCTGEIGACGVGGDHISEFREQEEISFRNIINQELDDFNCLRPASIWDTPGWFNHGMGNHFRDGQEEEAYKDYIRCCLREAYENFFDIYRVKEWILTSNEPLNKNCSYRSVGIFFKEKPTEEHLETIKRRSKHFCEKVKKSEKINITGYRLLKFNGEDYE